MQGNPTELVSAARRGVLGSVDEAMDQAIRFFGPNSPAMDQVESELMGFPPTAIGEPHPAERWRLP